MFAILVEVVVVAIVSMVTVHIEDVVPHHPALH
jgi:hypothetical protein